MPHFHGHEPRLPDPRWQLWSILLGALWRDDPPGTAAPRAVVASAFQRWYADAYGYLQDPHATFAVAQEAPLLWILARIVLFWDCVLPWLVRARPRLATSKGARLGNVVAADMWVRRVFDESAAAQVVVLTPGLGTRTLRHATARVADSWLGAAVYEVESPQVYARKAMLMRSLGLDKAGAAGRAAAASGGSKGFVGPAAVPVLCDITDRPRRLRLRLERAGFDVRRRTLVVWEEGMSAGGVPALVVRGAVLWAIRSSCCPSCWRALGGIVPGFGPSLTLRPPLSRVAL